MDKELRSKLAAPIAGYKWRLQQTSPKDARRPYPAGTRGLFMAYIDARDLYDRLDDVFGVGGWKRTIVSVNADGSVIGRISVKIGNDWIDHDDIGYSNEPGASYEKEPLKAAASDAFKRAGVGLGIGRFLYELDAKWVEIDQYGKPVKGANLNTGEIDEPEHRDEPKVPARARSTTQNPIPKGSDVPETSGVDPWTTFWNEVRAHGLSTWAQIESEWDMKPDDFRNGSEALAALRAKTGAAA